MHLVKTKDVEEEPLVKGNAKLTKVKYLVD